MKNITKSLAIILSFQSIAMPGANTDQRGTISYNVSSADEAANANNEGATATPDQRIEAQAQTIIKLTEEEKKISLYMFDHITKPSNSRLFFKSLSIPPNIGFLLFTSLSASLFTLSFFEYSKLEWTGIQTLFTGVGFVMFLAVLAFQNFLMENPDSYDNDQLKVFCEKAAIKANSLANNDLMSLESVKSASRINELIRRLSTVEKALHEFKSWKKGFDLTEEAKNNFLNQIQKNFTK
jgi:hypothetical protein